MLGGVSFSTNDEGVFFSPNTGRFPVDGVHADVPN